VCAGLRGKSGGKGHISESMIASHTYSIQQRIRLDFALFLIAGLDLYFPWPLVSV